MIDEDEIMFMISKRRVQEVAREKLDRTLSDDELRIIKKGLESGLNFDLEAVFEAAFEEL